MRARLLLMLVLGALSALGFAPVGWWLVTLAALAGLVLAVRAAGRGPHAFLLGYAFGVGHFVVGLNWIAGAFRYQDAMPVWLGWIAVVVLSLYLAVYPALAALAAWRFRARPAAFALAWGAAWIATEWLRATLFTGFAWNPLAVVLVPTPADGLARAVGTYGVSGLVAMVAVALADRRRLVAFPLALGALLMSGWLVLRAGGTPPATERVVRIVQPNIGQQDRYVPDYEARNFARLAALSGRPGARPRLLLWPEYAVPWYLEEDAPARARIAALLGPRDAMLLGGNALIWSRAGDVIAARNAFFVLRPGGRIAGRYDKAHLVPYGEYLPMRPLLSAIGLQRLVPGDLDFWPGPGPVTLDVPGFGRVGGQICYEIIFSGQVVDRRRRPGFVFNPSNDAWFGAWGPPQHLAQARLRAVEEGLPIVRSTPTGISAVIDATGRLLVALPYRRAGFIETRVPGAAPPTPFAHFGNTLPLLLALLLAGGAVALLRRGR